MAAACMQRMLLLDMDLGGYDTNCTTPITSGTTTVNGGSTVGSVFDIDGSVVTLRNLLIIGGNALGGGVDVTGGSSRVTLDNTDVYDNQSPTFGGGIYVATGSVVTLTNDSDIHDNLAGSDGGGFAGLNLDPKFVAPGAGENYHLQVSSPAVNACVSGLAIDLDKQPRPSGTRYDMGAYEHIFKTVYLPQVLK
jgi:hypothetical protein